MNILKFYRNWYKIRMAISNNDALAIGAKFFIEALGIILIIVIGFVVLSAKSNIYSWFNCSYECIAFHAKSCFLSYKVHMQVFIKC